jgi:riboflavin kinase/FMN adenylyltransferase
MACYLFNWQETPPADCRHGAVSIGNFDGVHRGHAALVGELRTLAKEVGGPAVAVTFDPHPLKLLRPAAFMPVLTTMADRAALLQAAGANHVLILQTTPELLQLSPADFFAKVVRERLGARALAEGINFSFGRNREGNVDVLKSLCQQDSTHLKIVSRFQSTDGRPISSSRVRAAIDSGNVREAVELLGRPYRLRGQVAVGQRRGHKLGFPTANLEQLTTLVPCDGVYAVRAEVDGASWPGAANIGPNPTFGEHARKVEVHLIGFPGRNVGDAASVAAATQAASPTGDLYGRELAVDFLERLRDTRPFPGVDALMEQLRKDVAEAQRIAGGTR